MGKYVIEDTTLTNIADAIRTKTETTEQLTPTQMPAAISGITTRDNIGVLVHLNQSSSTTMGTGKYDNTEAMDFGSVPRLLGDVSVRILWKHATTTSIWPINNYYNRWASGHTYRILFYIFTDGGTVEWNNNNIYVNENYTYTHNLKPVTSEPQLVDFTFEYIDSGSIYDPTIHIYPSYTDDTTALYVTPILIIDENAAKHTMPVVY